MATTTNLNKLVINQVDSEETYQALTASGQIGVNELYFIPGDSSFVTDDTPGGTQYSTAVITSGAVYAGLAGKANISHLHNMADIRDGVQGVYFVKGTQTASTAVWTGNLPTVEALYDGLTIAYFLPFAGTSTSATLTLTLKGGVNTAAEPVYYTSTTRATTHYGAGSVVVLTWVSNATSELAAVGNATGRWLRADYNSDANTVPTATLNTAAATAAKTATCTYYTAKANSYVHVTVRYSNTSKTALTLNINSQGAKPIYINGAPSSTSNYTLPAGTYIAFYDGTNYYFRTDDKLPANIDGDAGTVTGHTVAKDVPADAKFTDTTYESKTAASGGTDVSLVTTGEKYLWNSKTSNTGTITGVSVNGTSVATSGVANITSVPASILTGAIKNGVTATTQTAGDNSTKVATTAYVDAAVAALPEGMVFKGSLGTGGTITSLPTAAAANEGFTYKVITAGTYASQAAKIGDMFISNGSSWVLIPSGDEPGGTVTSVTITATSPISINSSAAITTTGERTISHANSGVTAGTYRSVTVNATGHVTGGTNPTTLSGYGITDAKIASGTITLGSNTITPLTADSSLNAAKLTGTVPSSCYTDTKNTAGSTDTSSKIYLVGATSQAANPQTYSDNQVYATNGQLDSHKVRIAEQVTLEYNNTTKSLDFVFA